jgi:hypothetical protein
VIIVGDPMPSANAGHLLKLTKGGYKNVCRNVPPSTCYRPSLKRAKISIRVRWGVRLNQTQASKISDGPQLIVDCDRFGIVHSEQDLVGGINAHVIPLNEPVICASYLANKAFYAGAERQKRALAGLGRAI